MITIYTENRSSRLQFICDHLFRTVMGSDYRLTSDRELFSQSQEAKICYAESPIGNAIHIAPSGLLNKGFRWNDKPQNGEWHNLPIFCQTCGEVPFDLLGAAFFLVARMEEYHAERLDQHLRFRAEESIAFQHGFLERPIVDEWALELKAMIADRFPETRFDTPKFRFIPTIDVDNVYAFQYHGVLQTTFCVVRDLLKGKKSLAMKRLRVVLRREKDPFFNLEETEQLHLDNALRPAIFFHCGAFGKHDKRTLIPSRAYREIRRTISRRSVVGLHPSYHAPYSPLRFKLEKWAFLRSIETGEKRHNRFHYLRFQLPQTYRMLECEGFTDDWSMCYSNDPGYRAGTSFPFPFYDLEEERVSKLTIHPSAVMDKTLRSNKGMSPNEAKAYILRMAERVRRVNGEFVTLFHNQHLTDEFEWRGWREMYQTIVNHLAQHSP